MSKITMVDLGYGNIASVTYAFERIGVEVLRSSDPTVLEKADRLVLPGVGAAQFAMEKIDTLNLREVLCNFEKPLFGICLGMQILYQKSEEGEAPLLGLLEGTVTKLKADKENPVPHMGWSSLKKEKKSELLSGIDDGAFAYFVHSYSCPLSESTILSCSYTKEFSAAIEHNNIVACQFHPERSAYFGEKIIRNFMSV